MNVHIVCKEPNEERILSRLAQALAQATGWTLSATPRGDVALNYFLPYLDYEPIKTRTAAWFTHRDEGHDSKMADWERVKQAVDLRTTSARIYLNELQAVGASELVTPPLDRQQFTLAPRKVSPRPVVGVSGFVYRGGRKGEALVERLARDRPMLDVMASGRGWPVPTRYYAAQELQRFYQCLDVYLCTSTIEGIPMPPLEALACGIPIVVPQGVGLLDDLLGDGVFHYQAGDYSSMVRALDLALAWKGDHEALRALTEPYTVAAWAASHERAFEALLNPLVVQNLDHWQGRSGMYCVAFGDPARACAERLLRSWHQFMPDVPAALVSDRPLGPETVFIQKDDYDIGGRHAKLSIDDLAPQDWQYLLYLDADTELVAPVPFLFDLLVDGWEFVICKNPGKYHTTRLMVRPDNKAEVARTFEAIGYDDLLQLNGGVFGYRRSARTAAFFARWVKEWMQEAKRDQAALLRALWAQPLKLYVLGNEWNTMDEYCAGVITAGIEHHQKEARRVSGIVWERGDSPEAFNKVIR